MLEAFHPSVCYFTVLVAHNVFDCLHCTVTFVMLQQRSALSNYFL